MSSMLLKAFSIIMNPLGSQYGPTRPHPCIDLVPLELPEAADPMAGHALGGDPRLHGVLADAEVLRDFLYRQPTVIHRDASPGWSDGCWTHRA
jgi:hypothetical protein